MRIFSLQDDDCVLVKSAVAVVEDVAHGVVSVIVVAKKLVIFQIMNCNSHISFKLNCL